MINRNTRMSEARKRSLYESIMRNVAKEVRNYLNEMDECDCKGKKCKNCDDDIDECGNMDECGCKGKNCKNDDDIDECGCKDGKCKPVKECGQKPMKKKLSESAIARMRCMRRRAMLERRMNCRRDF